MGGEYYTEDAEGFYRERVFSRLSGRIHTPALIYLCVSGGSDSMYLTQLVDQFIEQHSIFPEKVILLHYQHNQRPTQKEVELIQRTFPRYELRVGERDKGIATERDLRKGRREFIESEIVKSDVPAYVFTGHNLTDRIETTFLNMCRGSNLQGISNMKRDEIRSYLHSENKGTYTLIRPLLDIEKLLITSWCKNSSVEFIEDCTNERADISKRNLIRNEIFPLFGKISEGTGGIEQFYKSFLTLYNNLEDLEVESGVGFSPLQASKNWNVEVYHRITGIKKMSDVSSLLKQLGAYRGITTSAMKDLLTFILQSKSGRKYINGYYFFKAHGTLYTIKKTDEFWKKNNDALELLQKEGVLEWGGFQIDIRKEHVGGIVRYPKKGDRRKKKPLSKYFIAQKIPFFRRKSIPVIEKNEKLVYIYPFQHSSGYT